MAPGFKEDLKPIQEKLLAFVENMPSEQAKACFPSLAPALAIADERRAKRQAALQRQEEQLAAEREMQQRQTVEERQRETEQRAEAQKPPNMLRTAYARYILVKRCHETRQGYAAVYISDIELARARNAIRRLEEMLIAKEPSMNTD